MSRLDGPLERLRLWDVRTCAGFNRVARSGPLLRAFRLVSALGDGIFWYALMLAMLLIHGIDAAPAVVHMFAVGIVCTLLYRALKRGTLRPRPFEVHAHIAAGSVPLDRFSFPSGHTLHAVAFTIVVLAYFPALALLLIPLTIAIAASRMALGLHYPSDVLAGAALGALVAGISLKLI